MYLLGLGLVIVLGVLLTAPLTGSLSRLERVAMGWGVGLGSVTLILFLLSAIGLSLTLAVVWAVVIVPVSILASWWLLRHSQPVPSSASDLQLSELPHSRLALTSLEAWLLFLLLISLAVTVFQAVYWPIYDNDSLVGFDFKAHLMVQRQTVNLPEYRTGPNSGTNFFYPPLVPLGYSMVYWFGGEQAKAVTVGCWLSLLAVLYAQLRRRTSRLIALVALVLLAYAPVPVLFATHGMTNIPVAFYLVAGAIYLDAWQRESRTEFLWLGALLLGLAGWIRTDIVVLVAASWIWVLFRMITTRSRTWLSWVGGLVIAFSPALLWQVYLARMIGIPGTAAAPWFFVLDANRFVGTVWALIVQILDPMVFGGIGAAFVLALLLAAYRRRVPSLPLLALISLYAAAWIGLFYVIELESRYATLYNSGQRILIAIVPVVLYCSAQSPELQRLADGLNQAVNQWIETGEMPRLRRLKPGR